MKAEKLAAILEKLSAKVEGINHSFKQDDHQNDFDALKAETICNLADMIELLEEDSTLEHEEENE